MIIFCFLTYNDLIPINYWNNFFNNVDTNKYKVFIHSKYNINYNIYNFPVNIIKKKVKTLNKCDITIVRATLQLLRESFDIKEANHFIFCSQNCIPLHEFNFYENFLKNINKSIVSCIIDSSKQRFNHLSKDFQSFLTYDQFIKQQPNMILTRSDVELLINNDLTNHFKNMQCPDEHYFVNILLYILKKDIIKSQTHFCNFDLTKTQAIEFRNIDLNSNLISDIKNKGFLFMRKVY